MDITGKLARVEPPQQPGDQVEVSAVDQLPVCLERVSAVSDAVEDGPRLHALEQRIQVRVDKQVGYQDMIARQALEPPGGKPRSCPIDVLTMLQQRAQQIGADEAARAQEPESDPATDGYWRS